MKDIQTRYFGAYKNTDALWELDCSKDMFRILYFVAFDQKDEIIYSSLTPDADWVSIVPGSVGESVLDALCH